MCVKLLRLSPIVDRYANEICLKVFFLKNMPTTINKPISQTNNIQFTKFDSQMANNHKSKFLLMKNRQGVKKRLSPKMKDEIYQNLIFVEVEEIYLSPG